MRRQLTNRQRLMLIVILTVISVPSALFLGHWGRLLSVILIGFALALLTNGCLRYCTAHDLRSSSSMLFSLLIATGYVLVILGSYGYFRG